MGTYLNPGNSGFAEILKSGYVDKTELIGGVDVRVNTNGFANDLVTFKGRDDVLTLMIHLGYLAYNSETKTVRIPNEEIKLEFQKAVREVEHEATLKRPDRFITAKRPACEA